MNYLTVLFFLVSFSLVAGEPEAIYLTWQKDPTTTMTVQWISKQEDEGNSVTLIPTNEKIIGTSHALPQNMPYTVHWAEITNLSPGTKYTFRIEGSEKVWQFQTADKDLSSLTFAVGGDTFQSKEAWFSTTCEKIAEQKPLFIAMGGDLAYASPNKKDQDENGNRWLTWIKLYFKNAVINENQLIPLLVTIGNHDVKGHYNGTNKDAPFFYSLFSFPGEQGYNVLNFGNYLSFYFLDTNHTHPIGGAQAEWLENSLKSHVKALHTFAIYHVPAYPSVRAFGIRESADVRKHWVPLFEKYHVDVAFENHDHVFKRTFPLKNGVSAEDGVLYIGDGSWGVKPRVPKKAKKIPYLAKTASTRQFLKVTIRDDGREFTSISPSGDIVDHYVQLSHDTCSPE